MRCCLRRCCALLPDAYFDAIIYIRFMRACFSTFIAQRRICWRIRDADYDVRYARFESIALCRKSAYGALLPMLF